MIGVQINSVREVFLGPQEQRQSEQKAEDSKQVPVRGGR